MLQNYTHRVAYLIENHRLELKTSSVTLVNNLYCVLEYFILRSLYEWYLTIGHFFYLKYKSIIILWLIDDRIDIMTLQYDPVEVIFNTYFVKWSGFNRIFDDSIRKYHGYNVFQILALFSIGFSLSVLFLNTFELYFRLMSVEQFCLQLSLLFNLMLACYKMFILVQHTNTIKNIIQICYSDIKCSPPNSRNYFQIYQAKTIRATNIFSIVVFVSFLIWTSCPLLFYRNEYFIVENRNGITEKFKYNTFNFFFMASSEFYNNHYVVFLMVEYTVCLLFNQYVLMCDILILAICLSLFGQLRSIKSCFKKLAHKVLQCNYFLHFFFLTGVIFLLETSVFIKTNIFKYFLSSS